MTNMHQALERAMGIEGDTDLIDKIQANGLAIADVDTMSQAIHDVYCGIMADHTHPNEKDQGQARELLAALQRQQTA